MSHFITEIARILERDIQKTVDEISKYENDEDIWILPSGINNSAGTLALHIAGNLQYFIGTVLGGSGYVRNRPEEFEARDIPQAEIVAELNKAKIAVRESLNKFEPEEASKNYPEPFAGETVSNYFILIHLAAHLNYHLGQINYHRRLLTD